MTVELTPAQEALIQKAITNGRFTRAEDAVSEALILWEEHERQHCFPPMDFANRIS